MTDTRHWNIAGEIARLETDLARERDALRRAPDRDRRQFLRRNLAVGHEELAALYRWLHELAGEADSGADTLLWVGGGPAHLHPW